MRQIVMNMHAGSNHEIDDFNVRVPLLIPFCIYINLRYEVGMVIHLIAFPHARVARRAVAAVIAQLCAKRVVTLGLTSGVRRVPQL